ncbi:MAG: peptidoglycan-binding protein [Brevundimonas sp.]|nr:MAG: peptidoglycan-binding protein [Brevundimonas sp.]
MPRFDDSLTQARELLLDAEPRAASSLGVLAAGAVAAMAAVLLAGVVILGPGVALDQPAPTPAEATF